MSVRITGGKVLFPGEDDARSGIVFIADGVIGNAESGGKSGETIDAQGMLVAPGIVDLGVFATDKPAFKFGGITRAALLPDQSPVHDDPATVRFAALKGKPDFWVHPLAAATRGLDGIHIAEIALMKAAGALAVATGRQWISSSGTMMRVMQYCASLRLPLIVHSEDNGLTGNAVATAGPTASLLGLSAAPAMAEALSIARDIMLAEETGVHIHFRQVTTEMGLDLVRAAKSKGLNVTCGITPAHFLLSEIAVSDFRTFAKLSPPLRSEDDRLACIAAIADGTIDVISSGHDPRGPEDKRLPFSEALPGMAGAETLLALSLNLVRDNHISLGRMFELLSSNPARILGINAGKIAFGFEADLIFVDIDAPWQIDGAKMTALAANTPFDKLPVQGRVRKVMKGGNVIN
jgi:dihydroorotase